MRRDARTDSSCLHVATRRPWLAWLAAGSLALLPVLSTFGGEPAAALVAILAEIDAAAPLTKDAAVLADLQKVRDACQRARKARGDAKTAIAEVQAAREILAGLVGRKGADSPELQAHIARATKLADAWLARSAATPKDPPKAPPRKVLGPGVGPSSGAGFRFPAPDPYSVPQIPPLTPDTKPPGSRAVVDPSYFLGIHASADPVAWTGACDERVRVEFRGTVRTARAIRGLTVQFRAVSDPDGEEWLSPPQSPGYLHPYVTVPGGTYEYTYSFVPPRNDVVAPPSNSWRLFVRLVVVSPANIPQNHSDDVLCTGECRVAEAPRAVVRRDPVTVPFVPARHGFLFANTFANNGGFEIRTNGLCGGMVYAALDYYLAGRPRPGLDWEPAVGHPLQRYIFGRQYDTFRLMGGRWAAMYVGIDDVETSFRWGLRRDGGFGALRNLIDRGRPAPVDLLPLSRRTASGDADFGHQVLGIGYDMGRFRGDPDEHAEDLRISVYDPNFPRVVKTLAPDLANRCFSYVSSTGEREGGPSYRTFFVDDAYYAATWPAPPSIPDPSPGPRDGLAHALLLTIGTGGNHLRGQRDNLDVTVEIRGRAPLRFSNVNEGALWVIHHEQTVRLPLEVPCRVEDIVSIRLDKGRGDRWDVDSVRVRARGGDVDRTSATEADQPLVSLGVDRFSWSFAPAGWTP